MGFFSFFIFLKKPLNSMASRKHQRNVNAISVHFVKQELCLNDHHPGGGHLTHPVASRGPLGSRCPPAQSALPVTPAGHGALRRFVSRGRARPGVRRPEAPATGSTARAQTAQGPSRDGIHTPQGPGCRLREQAHLLAQGCVRAELWCSILVGGPALAGLCLPPPSPLVWGRP